MSHRFVYTDPDGREVRLETQADLNRAVASGAVGDDTPLFDELTSEWGPARTHALYRLAREEGAPAPSEEETPPESPEAAEDGEAADDASLGGLTLTDALPEVDVDDTVEDFKARLERERRQEQELKPGSSHDSLGMVRGDTVADLPESPAAESRRDPANSDSPPPTSRSRATDAAERARQLFPPADLTADGPVPNRKSARPRGLDGAQFRQVALLAGLIGIGAWGIADARATASANSDALEILMLEASQASEPPPEGLLEVRASAEAAFRDMRDGMDRIRSAMDVGEAPDEWLSGEYLSDPASAPVVREYWTRYGEFVDSIRSAEEELFRSGFATRLQQMGITGPVLSIRLARGLSDFRADRPRRDEVYGAMDALAAEALSLDDWLRSVEGRIAYAGVREDAVSMAPDLEAAALDPETAAELDRRLMAVLDALDLVTGMDPAEARNLTGRALGSLGGADGGRQP